MINHIDEMMKKTAELLENTSPQMELSEDNKAIISEIANFSRKTRFYQDMKEQTKIFWEKIGNPTDPKIVLSILVVNLAKVSSYIDMVCVIINLMPHLDDVFSGRVEAKES